MGRVIDLHHARSAEDLVLEPDFQRHLAASLTALSDFAVYLESKGVPRRETMKQLACLPMGIIADAFDLPAA